MSKLGPPYKRAHRRKAQNQWAKSHFYQHVTADRHGNVKPQKWTTCWSTRGKHIRWAKRHTNHQLRYAAKLQLAYELYEDEQWQEELYLESLDWYDDEPMDFFEEEFDDDPYWLDGGVFYDEEPDYDMPSWHDFSYYC